MTDGRLSQPADHVTKQARKSISQITKQANWQPSKLTIKQRANQQISNPTNKPAN